MFWQRKNFNFRIIYNKKDFFIRHSGKFLSILVIIVSLGIGIFAGEKIEIFKLKKLSLSTLVNKDAKPNFEISKQVDFSLFWEIWSKVKQDYARQPVDEVKMFYGAMEGMVSALGDPYSLFFEPQVAEEFQQELAGEFDGIGAEIGMKDNAIVIVSPLTDSPAEQAGLEAGDKIISIDGTSTKGIALDYAVKLIRGKKGTKVKLTISRAGLSSTKDYEITRDKIVVKSVQWKMEDDIAYIKVLQFGNDTADSFDKVVKQVILKDPKGIILDLRNNPGGYLDAAVKMAGEWIPDNVVVYERYQNEDQGLEANGKGRLKDFKTVVLVNKGSASGSEIVAGALKDYNAAALVGEQTFGKGSVQDYKEYKDGSALKLTIALWLTPKGTSIDGKGIEPNYKVELSKEDSEKGNDPQLNKAKELLK